MKRLLVVCLMFSVALFTSCDSAGKFQCYECDSTVELDEDSWEDEDGNSHSYNSYICEDCAYEKGYIDGYNALVDELSDGWPSDLGYIDEIPDDTDEYERMLEEMEEEDEEAAEKWNKENPDQKVDSAGNPTE